MERIVIGLSAAYGVGSTILVAAYGSPWWFVVVVALANCLNVGFRVWAARAY